MARPRKNPEDPKWNVGTSQKVPTHQKTDEWMMLFSAALTGLVTRGGFSSEQIIKTAKQYADEAYTAITEPRK